MKNIIERPIVPYNPSASRVVKKEEYSLFAPVATNGKVGMAAYDTSQFEIKEQTVSIKPAYISKIFADSFKKINAKTIPDFDINGIKNGNTLYYNCTITLDEAIREGVLLVTEAHYDEDLADSDVVELFIADGIIWTRCYTLIAYGTEFLSPPSPFVRLANAEDIAALVQSLTRLQTELQQKDTELSAAIASAKTELQQEDAALSNEIANAKEALQREDSRIEENIANLSKTHDAHMADAHRRIDNVNYSLAEKEAALEGKINDAVNSFNDTLKSKVTQDVNGNVTIMGNLDVKGEVNVVDTNTLEVDAPIAIVNASYLDDNADTPDFLNGGIVIMLDATNAFGIVYNTEDEKVIASLGTYENGIFSVQNPVNYVPFWNGESTDEAIPMFEGGKLKPSGLTKSSIEKIAADVKCKEWDHVITTEEAFINISSCTGTVLVKGLHMDFGDWYNNVADIVINATYVKFIDCSFAATYGAVIVGNKNCTLDGFYWLDGPDTIAVQNFGKVINCKQDKSGDLAGYPLTLTDCDYVHNTDFGNANNCSHISDCILTMAYGPVLNGCSHIHGLRIELQEGQDIGGECIFHECKYLSNISLGEDVVLNIIYHNCLFVDPDTCAGFLKGRLPDAEKAYVQALTEDGSFRVVIPAEEGGGGEAVSPTISVSEITGGHKLTITDINGEKSVDVMNGRDGAKGDKGEKGDTGAQGIQGIQGVQGEQGIQGIQGVQGEKGDPYILTATDKNEIAQNVKSVCIAKNQGASNVGKILVVGTDGNLTLADMPEGGASGDVIGTLDDSNNILLSGNLADGTYTLKYENEDGTYTEIGNLVVGEVKIDNGLFEPDNAKLNYRLNSTGVEKELNGVFYTQNYIPLTSANTYLYIKGCTISTTADSPFSYTGIWYYDASQTLLGKVDGFIVASDRNNTEIVDDTNKIYRLKIGVSMTSGALSYASSIAYARLVVPMVAAGTSTAITSDDVANVVIKIDEEIA